MVRLEGATRIAGVKISDIRITPMGATPGVRAKFALVDSETNPLSLAILHRFSDKTYKLIEELQESMEMDYASMLTLREGEESEEPAQNWEPEDDEDDGGFSLG